MQSKRIIIPGIGEVLLERSARARRINLSVRPFRGVRIAVPRGVPFQRAVAVAEAKAQWLKTHLARMAGIERQIRARPPTPVPDPQLARRRLVRRLAQLAEAHGFAYNRVVVRNQKTRWGSCSHKNNISLNINMVHLPGELIDYILLHELVHTRIKSHGRRFWDTLAQYLPRARALDRELNQHWFLLMPPPSGDAVRHP